MLTEPWATEAPASREKRQIALQLDLNPSWPRASPNTLKRGCVSRMDLADASTVMAQIAPAFKYFNELHPHSALKMKSPGEFVCIVLSAAS